jgi:hypothetical protein
MINRMSDANGPAQGMQGMWGDASASGVSWGAILAGAFAAAALSFILIVLGFGLGFSAVSPWSDSGVGAQTLGMSTIAWLIFTQIAASAIGGYLAGRLRVKWGGVHSDEVYFRDTAHGFLAWAVASLATAVLLAGAIGSVLSGGVRTMGVAAGSAAGAATVTAGATAAPGRLMRNPGNTREMGRMPGVGDAPSYFIDMLFRPSVNPSVAAAAAVTGSAAPVVGAVPADSADAASIGSGARAMSENGGAGMEGVSGEQRAEVTRIYMNALRKGSLSDSDKNYVAQILVRRVGMSQADAARRVGDTYGNYSKAVADAANSAKVAADKARKAAAYSALWMFVALLCGAFIASLCATFGGYLRDRSVLHDVEPGDGYPGSGVNHTNM